MTQHNTRIIPTIHKQSNVTINRIPSVHTQNRVNMLQMVAESFNCALALPTNYTERDINISAAELADMIVIEQQQKTT